MKKVLSLLLSVLMLITALPLAVFSDLDLPGIALTAKAETADITWSIDDGILTIDGDGDMPTYANSSSNRAPWYANRASITSVVISDEITSIGAYAFHNCTALASIDLPDGLTSIGSDAFNSCSALTEVTIPATLTQLCTSTSYSYESAFAGRCNLCKERHRNLKMRPLR